MIEFDKADSAKFAVFHIVYTDSNIFNRFNWTERVEDAVNCLPENTVFMYEDKTLIGGFALRDNTLNYPFLVPPFIDKHSFWGIVLDYAVQVSGQNDIFLSEMPESDAQTLIQSYGAVLRWSKQVMLKPTEKSEPMLCDGFSFADFTEKDMPEIIEVVYEAHAAGYTAAVWKPNAAEVKEAIERRFTLFQETDTLHMSNLVKNAVTQEIAGVCIAGIYPDSPNNFATLHQLSVKPEYRRKGIAKAMMLKSINEASRISPVMTLGVLIGNPAEKLYSEAGFAAGPRYSELLYTV